MIKLAFVVDTAYNLGSGSDERNKLLLKTQPEDINFQIRKISSGDHYAAGRRNWGIYKQKIFKPETNLFIVSRNISIKNRSEPKVQIINDYMELVQKYKDSKESLVIMGGKEILMLFLPYADRINVIITDSKILGDKVFKEWKTFNLKLIKIEEWGGGITYYYSKKVAQVY